MTEGGKLGASMCCLGWGGGDSAKVGTDVSCRLAPGSNGVLRMSCAGLCWAASSCAVALVALPSGCEGCCVLVCA